MQSVLSRIWTRIAAFISYGDNDYTTGTCTMGLAVLSFTETKWRQLSTPVHFWPTFNNNTYDCVRTKTEYINIYKIRKKFHRILINTIYKKPHGLGLNNTLTESRQRGKIPPPPNMCPGKCGVPLHCHYSLLHSDLEW